MLFSVRDFEILRLLRWCRCVSPSDLTAVFSETEISNLIGAGLVKLHTGSASLILTGKGQQLLNEEYGSAVPNAAPSYREPDIARRVRAAKLVLTAYRSGVHVFTTGMEALTTGSALFLPSLARARGSNLWGNSRIAAAGRIGELICGFHNIYPDAGKTILSDELHVFSANTSGMGGRPAMIFSGTGYREILSELDSAGTDTGNRLVPYGEAYRRIPMPVHLLSCDETGAMQLRIMSEPDYRGRLTRAALRGQYQPPMPELDCDAAFEGLPFFLAADMDLRRLDAAVKAAHSLGYSQIAMAALEAQTKSVLDVRYGETGLARIFIITVSALTEFFGHPPALYAPPDAVYQTKKGAVLYAPLIQTHRKSVPAYGKK